MSEQFRQTYAEIHLTNIIRNYISVSKLVHPRIVIPVVKANAYGHGAKEVTTHLIKYGVDHFAVSLLEEAIELRELNESIDILVMGPTNAVDYYNASIHNITVTVSNMDQIRSLSALEFPLKVHMKVDTGMNRLGFKTDEEIMEAFNILKNLPKSIQLEGLFTHFSTADCDKDYFDIQKNRFDDIAKMLNYDFKMIHASNSSSSIKYENSIDYTTHTRLGISLYGLTLDKDVDFLRRTYRLVSHIAEIKQLKKGEKVGYGATYTAEEDELIGVLPIGYADGFIRKNQGGDVEINNKRYKIIGRICMDQMFIKIDDSITKEDKVILMGGLISIDEVADRLDTINYEIICQITYRVPKIYREEKRR